MYVTISNASNQIVLPADTRAPMKPLKNLRKASYLYFEGDEVTHLYVIQTGVVCLTQVLDDGRRQVIAFGYPGDIVGFPSHGSHHTDCDALTDTTLRPVPRKALDGSSFDPKLHDVLIQAAMQEISAMQDHFMMLGRKSAPEKVAGFLNVLLTQIGDISVEPPVIDLPMSRSDIADFLGLTTETVCRCLTALRKAGIIRLDGIGRIAIFDQTALSLRADGKLN